MHFEALLTSEELRAQLERPLIAGILIVYFVQLFGAARYAMPVLASRQQKRFLAAVTAAFLAFVIGAVSVYLWTLSWLAEAPHEDVILLRSFAPFGLYIGGFSWLAAWVSFGSGALCEIPVLTFVLGRFGFRPLQNRTAGYTLILLLSASIWPTADLLPFVLVSVSFIAIYELSLGILHWKGFRWPPDNERYSY